VTGDLIRRNDEWVREKRRKVLELKQTVTEEDLKQCTFKPTLKSNESYRAIKSKYMNTTMNRSCVGMKSPMNESSRNAAPKKDFTQEEYEVLRRNLISKLRSTLN
jgi:hypothetical protein